MKTIVIILFFMIPCHLCCAKSPVTTGILHPDKAILTGSVAMPSNVLISETTKPIQMMQTEPMQIGIMSPAAPESIIIKAGDGQIRIHFDGKVKLENVTLDKAAQEFWKKVSDAFPQFKESILREAAAEQATRKEGGFFVTVPGNGL